MSIFYRWINRPEASVVTKSNHGITSIMVSPEVAAEIKASGRVAGNEYPDFPNAMIIPLSVYESTPTTEAEDGGVEIDVIPELDGVCCYAEIDEARNYSGADNDTYVMIFEGEQVGDVWDGQIARVENIIEVLRGDEFFAKYDIS